MLICRLIDDHVLHPDITGNLNVILNCVIWVGDGPGVLRVLLLRHNFLLSLGGYIEHFRGERLRNSNSIRRLEVVLSEPIYYLLNHFLRPFGLDLLDYVFGLSFLLQIDEGVLHNLWILRVTYSWE